MNGDPLSTNPGGGRWRQVTVSAGFVVLYLAATALGVALTNQETHLTPIWPAAGLALAALLHRGRRAMWPALLVATVAAGVFFETGEPFGWSGPVLGNFLGPLVGAWLTERFANGRRFAARANTVLYFMVAGACVTSALCASLGLLGLLLGGEIRPGELLGSWSSWFMSDFVGSVVLAPALLAWTAPMLPNDGDSPGGLWRVPEAILLALFAVLGIQATFGGWPFPAHHHALEYLCAPALLWAAFRFPHRGVATAVAALGTLAVTNTLEGRGPFAAPMWNELGEPLFLLQVFLLCVSGMVLATAAVVRERRAQAAALEDTVARRTEEIRAELAERICAERAGEESRAMLRRIIDLLPQAVWWKDRRGVYLGCNRLVAESAGLGSPGDLLGKTDAELPWPPGTAEEFRAVDERVMATGEPELHFVHQHDFPDGRRVTLESCKVPLRDDSGQVTGVMGTSEDITTRERIEAELRAARADLEVRVAGRTADLARANEEIQVGEERFRRAILDAPIPIILHAEDGEVLALSRAWTALTGYRHEDIPTIRHWVERAYPPERREGVLAGIRQLYVLERATEEGEFTVLTAGGEARVWDFSTAPLGRLPDGRRTVIASAKDVTERRHDEDALREGEERLRLALEAGRMSVWQFDVSSGHIIWSANARQDGRGWVEGSYPKTFEEFTEEVLPEDLPLVQDCIARCVSERATMTAQYRYRRRRDGKVRWLDSRARPRFNAAGLVKAITGLTQDITDRREAEDALHAAKAEAERANAAKSEFLSRMSHELRTPLNAILGFGQLLELAELELRHQQSVEHILRGGRHLLGLIDEVLDIARIETGQLTLHFEPVHAGELMGETINLLRPLAARHEVRIRPGGGGNGSHFSDAESTHVLADRQRLKQVMLNLLSNAVKYNHPGGEVLVSFRSLPGRRLVLEVRDTGRGLPPEDLARLFTPFERFGAERDGIEGTGIGLVIVRRLVESMGGQIHVESTPGVGSVFSIELPCVPPLEELAEAGNAPAAGNARETPRASLPVASFPASGPARTVLYIEDNLSNLQLIERIFERRKGHERIALLSAMQGGLGLDLARQHQPDLILLDLQLPDLSGQEVFARLRADDATRRVPVIILSADATSRQRETLLEAGVLAYLTKPLDVPRFLELVNRTLEGCAG